MHFGNTCFMCVLAQILNYYKTDLLILPWLTMIYLIYKISQKCVYKMSFLGKMTQRKPLARAT